MKLLTVTPSTAQLWQQYLPATTLAQFAEFLSSHVLAAKHPDAKLVIGTKGQNVMVHFVVAPAYHRPDDNKIAIAAPPRTLAEIGFMVGPNDSGQPTI